MDVRVLVVDAHEVFREGLRVFVESLDGYRIAAEAGSVRDACARIEGASFDVVIVDLALPGTPGMTLVRELKRRKRRERVLALTQHASADLASEALAAGALGFALKSDSRRELCEAVETVSRGERFLAASLPRDTIEELLLKNRLRSPETSGPLADVSAREREVFSLLVRGYSNEAAAEELRISPKTVRTHRTNLFAKLHVHSMSDLVRYAFRHQLMEDGFVAQQLPVVAVRLGGDEPIRS